MTDPKDNEPEEGQAGRTRPSPETRAAERAEATRPPGADVEGPQVDPPADREVDPSVRAHEKEMAERGAHQKGEGRVS
jgi:hypothetical protein